MRFAVFSFPHHIQYQPLQVPLLVEAAVDFALDRGTSNLNCHLLPSLVWPVNSSVRLLVNFQFVGGSKPNNSPCSAKIKSVSHSAWVRDNDVGVGTFC